MSQNIPHKTNSSSSSSCSMLQHPVPDFLQKGRNNPINGTTCFFSEPTFRRVVGPEISFRDKFMIHAARAKESRQKTEKKKKRQKDLDLPAQKDLDLQAQKDLDLPAQKDLDLQAQKDLDLPAQKDLDLPAQKDSDLPVQKDLDLQAPKDLDLPAQKELDLPAQKDLDLQAQKDSDLPAQKELDLPAQKDSDLPVQKDLDLPAQKNLFLLAQKELEPTVSKPLNSVIVSTCAENLNKSDNVSSGDDESEADLVIADDEEQDPASLAPVKVSRSSPDNHNRDTYSVDTYEKTETVQQVKENILSVKESADIADVSKPVEVVPLYATGFASRTSNSLSFVVNKNADSLEKSSSSRIIDNTQDTISDASQEPKRDEEVLCLVMPPQTLESDDNDGTDIDKIDQPGSSLPLIPALMSEPIQGLKSQASQKTVDLMKPKTTSHFYNSNQSPAKESTSHAQKSSAKPGPSSVSTEELEVDRGGVDVPIFSLAGTKDVTSPETGAKRSLRNKGIWSSGLEGQQNAASQKSKAKDNTAKDALKFKQSSLTRDQMSTYLELFEKYARPYLHGGHHPMFTEQQKRQMADFEALQGRVLNEQREFQSYLQQNAIRNPQFYTFIKGHAKHYAYTKVQSYRPPKNLVTKFSNKFVCEISLQVGTERVELTFQKHLLEMGSPPRVTLPDLMGEKNLVQIPHNMKKIELNFPSSTRNQDADVLHHESISEDKNAETLALKYRSDAVLSSSVFKCLLDNRAPDYKRYWNIPVCVKEHHTKDGVHKVVYLNKPIYEDSLLLRDCNALFHKYALRSMVSQSKHPPMYKSSRQQKRSGNSIQKGTRGKTADDPFDMFATDLEALETFGKTSLGKKDEILGAVNSTDLATEETNCRRSKRLAEAYTEKDSMSRSESTEEVQNRADDALESLPLVNQKKGNLGKRSLESSFQEEENNPDEEEASSSSTKKPRNEADESHTSAPEKLKVSVLNTDKSPSKSTRSKTKLSSLSPLIASTKTRNSLQLERQHSSYFQNVQASSSNPLDLILGPTVPTAEKNTNESGAKENPSLYTPHSEPLSSLVYSQWQLGDTNILMRTRSHGIYKTRNVYLTSKMEYQANHGVEQVTSEEMVCDWAACYIRPNSKLVRARINAFSSEIVMFEELECHQILKPSSSFRPADGFTFIKNLLSQLSSLGPGNYLVSHEPGKSVCGVRTLKQGARLDNIEKPLPIPPEKKLSKDNVPWIPIDPTILLPYHKLHQRIPATFLPRDVVITPGSKKPPQATVVAKLKNKKKKKKKNKFKKKSEQEFF